MELEKITHDVIQEVFYNRPSVLTKEVVEACTAAPIEELREIFENLAKEREDDPLELEKTLENESKEFSIRTGSELYRGEDFIISLTTDF